MKKIEDLKVKIFSDGADKKDMLEMNSKTFIKGLTTNPSLMKKAGENVGCKTIYLDYSYKDIKPKNPDFVTDTLLNAVYLIEKLQNKKV